VSVHDRSTVCTKLAIGIEIILDALNGLLGNEGQVEARFGPFGDSATLDARLVHRLHQTYHRLENTIGGTRWNSEVTWVMWNLVSICFEIVLASVQDRCSICIKHTIGS
jgi:hypothetical protein